MDRVGLEEIVHLHARGVEDHLLHSVVRLVHPFDLVGSHRSKLDVIAMRRLHENLETAAHQSKEGLQMTEATTAQTSPDAHTEMAPLGTSRTT